jgi:predicted short-subunit dehydrogenase-like oxidoreductase (DUF2520 family)
VRSNEDVARGAEVVLIGTPDAAIESVASELASSGALGPDMAVVHLSGAIGLSALEAARERGATVLSVHPLQTFPDVDASIRRIPGSAFAVTADSEAGTSLGERIARDVGGRPFPLADELKPLYHAGAVIASNYLVAVTALAEAVERAAGLEDPMEALMPIQRATLDNVAALGPAQALTGPAVRGDAVTVERNLSALAEHASEAVRAYVELARVALDLAERSGRLTAANRAEVEEVLERWR